MQATLEPWEVEETLHDLRQTKDHLTLEVSWL